MASGERIVRTDIAKDGQEECYLFVDGWHWMFVHMVWLIEGMENTKLLEILFRLELWTSVVGEDWDKGKGDSVESKHSRPPGATLEHLPR